MVRILSVSFWAQNAKKMQIFPESKSPDLLKIRAYTKSSRKFEKAANKKGNSTKNLRKNFKSFFF